MYSSVSQLLGHAIEITKVKFLNTCSLKGYIEYSHESYIEQYLELQRYDNVYVWFLIFLYFISNENFPKICLTSLADNKGNDFTEIISVC